MESAWRWFLIDLNHLGVMDAKWFLLAFARFDDRQLGRHQTAAP